MAYNKDVNYMAIIQDPNTSAADRAKAEASRNEKIADMNTAGTNTGGYTATYNHGNAPAGYTGSTKSNTSVSAAAQNIINQMNANSLKWYTDPASRTQLSAANQTLAQQLSALKETDANGSIVTYTANHNKDSGEWSVTPNYATASPMDNAGVKPTQPELAGLELGDKYGIVYDQPTIQKLLDDATKAQFGLRNQQQAQSENKFYNTMLDTQGTALDSLRKTQASAVATGASRGMAAANELSAILNLQQVSTDESTLLAQNRDNLNIEEAAGYKQNASDSLETSNALKQAIAGLSSTKYGYDTQGYAAILSYLAALADVSAQKYSSDTTLTGVKYNADANVAAAGKTYGSSGYTYNGGTSDTGSTPVTPGALDELNTKIAANDNGWAPDGKKYTISNNGDGTYTISNFTDYTGATGNFIVDQAEMEKIANNGYDPNAVRNPDYGTETVKNTYDATSDNKTMSLAEVNAYYAKYGQYPAGWSVAKQAFVGDRNVPNNPSPEYNSTYAKDQYTITGAQGQKISVGYGNYATTWTYNTKTGMWTNSSGNTRNMNDFKEYLKKQNQAYVKALN